ncbi:MAG: hypothetical protein P8P20_11670, partial [Acidimicrobiales bacterium]|nr:hypothetical protein [Acidimicrobiales bacterium]
TTEEGTTIAVTGVPVPIITTVSADGMVTTTELVPNAGETLAEAIRRTGTSRFRYTIDQAGYQFELGEITVTVNAGAFFNVDTMLSNGTVNEGAANELTELTFAVEGATATLIDPGADGGIDVTALNERGYFDVTFSPSAGATLDQSSITDGSDEFTLSGDAATNVVVDGGATLLSGTTFRYTFSGEVTTGAVEVEYIADRWMDSANTNRMFTQDFEVLGATADVVVPTVGGTVGLGEITSDGYLEVRFAGTQNDSIDHSTIDGGEIVLRDADGNEIELGENPTRIEGTDRYRYEILGELAVGTYQIEIVEGTFTDTATVPNANLAEIETFTIAVATVSLSDPAPGDVIDREVLNDRNYIDITFSPVGDLELDHDSIDGDEFTLSGADSQNLFVDDVELVEGTTYRYTFGGGQFDTGELTINFVEGSWNDCRNVEQADGSTTCVAVNSGAASTAHIMIITEADSFFIELSGGIILDSAGLFDEPLFEVKAEATIEIDRARNVFSLSFNGE